MNKKTSLAVLLPVMMCFFTMGFVDLVGPTVLTQAPPMPVPTA